MRQHAGFLLWSDNIGRCCSGFAACKRLATNTSTQLAGKVNRRSFFCTNVPSEVHLAQGDNPPTDSNSPHTMEFDKRSPDEEVNVTLVSDKAKVKSTPKTSVRKARSQSPTIARLTAVCAKLDAYLTFLITGTSTEKLAELPPTVDVQPTARQSSSARLRKRAKAPKPLVTQPQEKITYASTQTLNGDTKQKCSVEIWLPCVGADGDDDQNSTRVVSRDSTIVGAAPPRSRPWSTNRILSGTAYADPITADHLSSHSSTGTLVSTAPQHGDVSSDRLSKRAQSSRTMSTSKTDAQTSSDRSKHTRPRRLSKDTFQSATTKASMTSRTALPDLDRGFYSSEKRSGRRARRQFEHVRHSSDQAERVRKGTCLPTRAP